MTAISCNRYDANGTELPVIIECNNICLVGPFLDPKTKKPVKDRVAISMNNGAAFVINRNIDQMKQVMGVKVK